MRTTAERRRLNWKKAIRKRRIDRARNAIWPKNSPYGHDWYDNLHQYSKGKIHCSCPMCRSKTNDKNGLSGPAMNWPVRDQKRMDGMMQDEDASVDQLAR